MNFDYSKLRGQIREKYETQEEFAEEIGMNKATLSTKLNNKSEFSQYEIKKMCDKLNIPANEIHLFFFNKISINRS